MAQYVDAHQEMVKLERQMLRRVRDKKFLTKSEKRRLAGGHGWMITGARPAIVKAYNEVVRRINELQRDRKYGALLASK